MNRRQFIGVTVAGAVGLALTPAYSEPLDDTARIQRLIDLSAGGVVRIPEGVYELRHATLRIPRGTTLDATGTAFFLTGPLTVVAGGATYVTGLYLHPESGCEESIINWRGEA